MGLPPSGGLCTIAFLLLWCVLGIHSKSKHINVNLEAKWSQTPIILETSEFLATESNDNFWRFVDSIADLTKSGAVFNHHDEERYRLCLKQAERLISPLQMNLLKFGLSLRAHSPTIEMYNQVALEKKPPTDCVSFVEVNNMITCEAGAMNAFLNVAASETKPTLVKNDHIYPGGENQDVIVILYAEVGTESFQTWHAQLKELADNGKITYVLRHFIKDRPDKQLRLSGYGVELAIKSTEYKAKDDTKVTGDGKNSQQTDDPDDEVQGFLFSKLNDLHPELKDNLKEFRQHLKDSTDDLAPLKVWQLQDLSFQAAQRVISATPGDQLRTLRDISQNFPVMARSLVKTQVTDKLRTEIQRNQEQFMNNFGLGPGDSAMFINGLQADLDIYDVFTLLDSLKSEAKLMEGLYDLGKQYDVKGAEMMELLNLDLRDTDSNYAIDIRDDSVVYLNNLEKDSRYRSWPGSVQDLLRPTFPGMLRHIRKNLHHVVFAVDPADKKHKDLLKMAEAFLVHNAPVRLGLLFVVNPDPEVDGTKDAGVAMLRAFNYIRKHENPQKALSFITDIYEHVGDDPISPQFVMQQFLDEAEVSPNFMVEGEDCIYDEQRLGAYQFFERTGLGELPQVLVNGVPMKKSELEADEFEEAVVSSILKQTSSLQTAVFNNEITDRTDLLEYVMTRSNVMPRLNSRVLGSSDLHLDLTAEMPQSVLENVNAFAALTPAKKSAAILAGMNYVTRKEQDSFAVTTLVVGDLNTVEGRTLLYAALKHLKHSTESRIGVIHNPTSQSADNLREENFIPMAVQAALATLDVSMAKSFITKLVKEENVEALKKRQKTLEDLAVHNMDFAAFEKTRTKQSAKFLKVQQMFANKVLMFEPGQRGVVSNGKVLGPLKSGEEFIQEDFDLLDKYMGRVSGSKIQKKVEKMGLDSGRASDLIMRATALLTSISQKESRKDVPFYSDKNSVVTLPPGEEGEPAYQVVAILDPTTRAAQKYTPLLMVLQEVANVNIKVFFNCREKLSEMPLKSFYRYVLEPELGFAVDSSLTTGPEARFVNVPESPLLTMGMDPPESWLVESVRTPYDLDNIYLKELDSGIVANYELEHLLLEGHCYDSVSSQPPRGLQFILGTNTTQDMVDTIVMANLGYFQLKATPGVWNLRLRPGRSEDIYQITSHELTDSPPNSPNVLAVMDSFKTKIIKIKVSKQSGKEREELLTEEEPSKGLWDSISSSLTGGPGTAADSAEDDTINIFSLASGHLYERLMRIMMLSVLKHTKSKVKFWFLKNYLSPTFKDFIPHMAKEYNFEYQLVQYKWPRWLHQQSEKQRIIWGYKILFLDVLFPLNLNKFIFVDADQIVRADLKELVDLDLEGAPYGYTPFCDSRKEMDGFRFWKSGYWASHLAGRKYHISALYVVDLKKFRKIAAGDRLRGQYQGLSQDPNSLSNLDQDLPNNMIHQVNIKTLPQEWLYCDTWCHESELVRAKTIDLCNNPLTKEPKLSAAVRLVPEWKDYDMEVKKLWDSIYNTSTAASDSSETSSTDKMPSKKIEL